jgi:hypothetical protein
MPNKPIRRVITGHDRKNVAKVIREGEATNTKNPRPGVCSTLMWSTDRMPADIAVGEDVEDMGARILGTAPPENGTRFIVMEFAPGIASEMHRTETIDYIAVLDGEIDMDMDDSTVTLWSSAAPTMPGPIAASRRRALPSCSSMRSRSGLVVLGCADNRRGDGARPRCGRRNQIRNSS